MKAAFALLLVALSCYFGTGHTGGVATSLIPINCLQKLIRVDIPLSLENLRELLCLYCKAKKENNQILYWRFLEQLHQTLIRTGCTVDEILSTKDFLAKVGDNVGEVAQQLGMQIFDLMEKLGVSDIVLNVVCGLLGETLKSLSVTLAGINLGGIPIIG